MDPRSPLGRHQRHRLSQLRGLGLLTDVSLAAYLAELGQPFDPSALAQYRAGRRAAPLGLLDLVLQHVDDPAAVLTLWARDHDLVVVRDGDEDTDERALTDRVLEAVSLAGDVASEVRRALGDGELDDEERSRLLDTLEALRRSTAELMVMLRRTA